MRAFLWAIALFVTIVYLSIGMGVSRGMATCYPSTVGVNTLNQTWIGLTWPRVIGVRMVRPLLPCE